MIEDALTNSEWTSASPGFTNRIKNVNFTLTSEGELATGLDETLPTTVKGQEMDDNTETVTRYKDSGVDTVSRFTTEQMGNVTSLATNPLLFVSGAIGKAISKGGPAILLIALGKLVETIFDFFLQPGREFDVRFREVAQDEILKFTDAQEQTKIRAGFAQIIVTTIGGLRGDAAQGKIGGNFYNRNVIPIDRIDPRPITTEASPSTQGLGSKLTRGQKRFNR